MNAYAGRPAGGRARVIAELTLPEALVIWSLRKCRESGDGDLAPAALRAGSSYSDLSPEPRTPAGSLNGLLTTFTKVFGHKQVSEAIEAFGEVIACLDRGARCQIRINAYAEECLSVHEEHLLSILDALQQAELERAAMLVQWLIESAHGATFLHHAHCFARLLSGAGHLLTKPAINDSSGRQKALGNAAPTRAPVVTKAEDLTLGESIILQGTRRWVACLHQEQDPFPALQAHFAHYGIIHSAASLNAVLRNIAFGASRTVDIHGPSCPGVSPDEAALLHAVAGYQRADSKPAHQALHSWMPASAIRLSAGVLASLADSLLAAGLILPLRARDLGAAPEERHAGCWRSDKRGQKVRTLH